MAKFGSINGDATPGLTNGQGASDPAWIEIRPPATHMGAYVIEVGDKYLAMDRSAFKALIQKMVQAL